METSERFVIVQFFTYTHKFEFEPFRLSHLCTFFKSNWLNEKSDVYSFGVVLLEVFTGQPVIIRADDHESSHVSQWVDSRLGGEFQINSAWKAVELATACVCQNSMQRPTMNQVVTELKECLALEIAPKRDSYQTVGSVALNLDTDLNPLPRLDIGIDY